MKLVLRNQNLARRACPLCRERVEGSLRSQRSCSLCDATYHHACLIEMTGGVLCSTLGCSGALRVTRAISQTPCPVQQQIRVRPSASAEPTPSLPPVQCYRCSEVVSPRLVSALWPMRVCRSCLVGSWAPVALALLLCLASLYAGMLLVNLC